MIPHRPIFFMTIEHARKNVELVLEMFPAIVEQIVRDSEQEIVSLNQKQLFDGKNADGDMLFPPYSQLTVELKSAKGQPTDRVTLKDTGAFYRGMFIDIQGEDLIISSTDSKTDSLVEKYGERIFGLTSASIEEIKPNMNDRLVAFVAELLGM